MAETFATPDEDAVEGHASDLQSSWAESWAANAQAGLFGGARTLWGIANYHTAAGEPVAGLNMPDVPSAADFELFEKIRAESPEVPIADARTRVKQEGLDQDLKLPDQPSIRKGVLDLMIQDAQDRRRTAAVVARGPQNFGMGALNFATSVGVGLLDPVNDAAFMVPVLGEARTARLLASAGESVLARGAVRFGTGALQGAAGSALLEPADWWLHTQDGQDYTYADTLRNIGMGSVMGGTMHAGLGAYGDIRALLRGRPLPGSRAEALEQALMTGASPAAIEAGLPLDEAFPADIFEGGERGGPTPDEIFDDLPAPARGDVMRAAAADIMHDRPGRAGELLAIAAQQDPRIAASLDADTHAARRAADGERAVYDDVRLQLELAGMSAGEADANAAIVAARYAARAARLGAPDAYTVYQGEGLSIRGPGGLGDETEQAMRAYAQRQRDLFAEREAQGQTNLPGTERIGEGELAQRRADQPLRPKVEQKPMDVGLFGDEAAQKTLFQAGRRLGPEDYRRILEQQRELEGIRAAMRDPQTGKVYTGWSHQAAIESVPKDDATGAWARLHSEWDRATENAGFVDRHGNFISRAEAERRWNVLTMEDIRDLRNKGRTFFQSGPPAPPFYSAVGRAIDAARQERASPEQWLATIRNTSGVKAEEMEWLGLADWLREQKGSVTRQEIADFIRANMIEVHEVARGARAPATAGELAELRELERRFAGGDTTLKLDDADRLAELRMRQAQYPQVSAPAKFERWTLPGGKNYGELVLTLPGQVEPYRPDDIHFTEEGGGTAVVWIRYDDRVIDGKRTLVIQEVQSKRHQEGRKRGYRSEAVEHEATAAINDLDAVLAEAQRALGIAEGQGRYGVRVLAEALREERTPAALALAERLDAAQRRYSDALVARGQQSDAVPDAPFKTSWPQLALKRMIRYAAEHGYDQIAWTPGEVQAQRYDLSKQINKVEFTKSGTSGFTSLEELETQDHGHLVAIDHDGRKVLDKPYIAVTELPDYIGKDLADRLMAQEGRRRTAAGMAQSFRGLSGLDLKVGGEGMLKFYDDMLPAAANKITKKYGAKTGVAKLATGDVRDFDLVETRGGRWQLVDRQGNIVTDQTFRTGAEAEEWLKKSGETDEVVHTLPITPALREAAVGEGFPLFQAGEAGPRGRIMLAENKAIVDLFKSADASTFMHEMGHKWLEELARDAARDNVPQAIKDDLGTVLRWLGVDKAEDIDRARHEQFARGIERYLAEGVAPSAKLAGAFEKFKQWLLAIYRALARTGEDITPEVRGVFDRMLATDEEIAARRGESEQAASPSPAGGSAGAEPVARKRFGPAARDPATWSLFEFLAHRGGLKPNGELATIFGGKNPQVFGFGRLLRPRGMTLDRALEAAVEAGYFVEPGHTHGGVNEIGIEHLLQALDHQARGNRVYRVGEEREAAVDRGENLHHIDSEIDAVFTENGLDPKSLPDSMRARMVEIMDREGVRDPLDAYERAIMEEDRRGSDEGQHPPAREFIPGWDVPEDAGAAPGAGERGAGGEPAARAAIRPARRDAGKAAVDPAAWRPLAEPKPDPEADAIAAASRAAAAEPEPASVDPLKSPSAAEAAAAAAEQALKDLDPFLTAEERTRIRDALAALDADRDAQQTMIQEGAACLMAAAGAAV